MHRQKQLVEHIMRQRHLFRYWCLPSPVCTEWEQLSSIKMVKNATSTRATCGYALLPEILPQFSCHQLQYSLWSG
jgi:hypothetical protein